MSKVQFNLLRSLLFSGALALSTSFVGAQTTDAPPVAYSSVNELSGILTELQNTAQSMQADLQKARVEKWKTDGSTKRQTQNNVESLKRNLQTALPEVITQLNTAPDDVGLSFRLYRNLDALYDVFGSVVESAGAFGSKDEFQSLSNDMSSLENARRTLGERVQKLTSAREEEIKRLRIQVKTLAAGPPTPPKKNVVDDTEPVKKPATKRKTAKPKPAPVADPAAPNSAKPPQ